MPSKSVLSLKVRMSPSEIKIVELEILAQTIRANIQSIMIRSEDGVLTGSSKKKYMYWESKLATVITQLDKARAVQRVELYGRKSHEKEEDGK